MGQGAVADRTDFDDLTWLPRRATCGGARVVLADLIPPELRRRKPLTEFPASLDCLDQVLTSSGAAEVDYAFLPDAGARALLRRARERLFTLGVRGQTPRPVREAAILGINMMNHLQLPGLFTLLDLCGVPILREERGEDDPLVIVGGHAWPNPLPLSDFVDVVVGGEGEDVLSEVATAVAGSRRADALRAIASLPGAWVAAHPRQGIAPARVLVASPRIPTGSSCLLRGVGAVVLSRGCPYRCAFCTSAVVGGPYRAKPWDQVAAQLRALADAGGDRVVLVAASVGAWHADGRSIGDVVAEARRLRLRVRPMTDRPDALQADTLLDVIEDRGKVCLAPEASPRLRKAVLCKTITEEVLDGAIDEVVAAGIPHIRLYVVLDIPTIPAGVLPHLPEGAPGEGEDDYAYLSDLAWRTALRLRRRHPGPCGPRVTLDCMPLLPTLGTALAGLRYPSWESYGEAVARLTRRVACDGAGLRDVVTIPALDWPTWFLQGYLEHAGAAAGRNVLAAWEATGRDLPRQGRLERALFHLDPCALAFTRQRDGPPPYAGIWMIGDRPYGGSGG